MEKQTLSRRHFESMHVKDKDKLKDESTALESVKINLDRFKSQYKFKV